ncbi:T9SS type A sorting domain-containing protein [Flavobacterium sp.]|uniref:T9SS type A sorting domain-containing protein n=1 Tax=Flavobacterium sp. TaxID=239 RepID=UPI0039E2D33E
MKRIVFLLLLLAGTAQAQIVNIPDANFKAKLLEADVTNNIAMNASGNNMKIDTNNDGEIQQSEALAVYRLRFLQANVINPTGLSSFTNLTHLECSGNIIFNLDLSALTNLTQLNCSANFLQTIDVSALTNLTQFSCDSNRLTSITGLENLTNLVRLSCSSNRLTSLDMTHSPGLILLLCQSNLLTSLNVAGLSQVSILMCSSNKLPALDLTGMTNLQILEANNNELASLNVSSLANLESLNVFYNHLTSLDLSQNTPLEFLSCGENNIPVLNLNGLTNLNSLECSYLPNNAVINALNTTALAGFQYAGSNTVLTLNGFPNAQSIFLTLPNTTVTVNVSGMNANTDLMLYQNNLTSLTINATGTTYLKSVNCFNNQLTTLSLNGLTNLSELICRNNKLTTLSLTGLTALTNLDLGMNKVTTLNLADTPNLKYLNCNNNKLTALNIAGLTQLEFLDCSNNASTDIVGNQIPSLALSGLTNLKYLDCSNYMFNGILGALGNTITSLDVNGLTQMEQLKCSKNNIPTLVVNGLTHLTQLDCSYNLLTSLDLIGLTDLTHLNYSNNSLSNLNMTGLVNITELNCANNQIETLTVVDMPNLTKLTCSNNNLETLDLSGLNLITSLICDNNELTDLNVDNMPNLFTLITNNNPLGTLNVNHLSNLAYLQCSGNGLTTLTVDALSNLQHLNCTGNNLINLDLGTLTNLYELSCDFNALTNLSVNNLPLLRSLSCSNNNLTALDISSLANLESLDCRSNSITGLTPAAAENFRVLACNNNAITTLDVSMLPRLTDFLCNNNLLTTLNMKNGSYETNFNASNNPTLTYICVDDMQAGSVQSQLNVWGMTSTVSNSYCSFTPGGPHNTVMGTTIFDGNNNGCNLNDPLHPNIRIDITDNFGNTGSAFTDLNGNCTFYTEAGNYTIFPNIENASAFNISPASAAINFPNNNNNVSAQSFCLSPNGNHPDVEVAISPVGPARPGFDAEYKVVYKNKGNQTLSGDITLTFEDDKIDFISADPTEQSQAGGNLTWSYSGLLPFETRSIHVIFNVNSPVETPPVNNGDLLVFSATVTPVSGDETPADNDFSLNQTVVGPFDPNDKTCLEGDTVSTEQIGQYLHYTINFENLGTAEAVNVIVKDVIDTNTFDINSLQVMYASHEMQAAIRGNVVEFIFRNINLAPVAGDPPVGGHGTILFKVKTLPTLENGSIAENTANIYFDYNAPVETNTARTTFSTLSTPEFTLDQSVVLHPNPASDFVNISCDSAIKSVELFDIQGRLLQTSIENKKQIRLDISGQSTGIYFARITTEKGKRVEKIIKE